MRLIGLTGWSGSGKTTLITALIPALRARGRTVSTIKHAHHSFDIDKPGKDSFVHRQAGAEEVLISSTQRWALMRELRGEPEPPHASVRPPIGLDHPGKPGDDGKTSQLRSDPQLISARATACRSTRSATASTSFRLTCGTGASASSGALAIATTCGSSG